MKILLVNTFYNQEGGAQKSTTFLAEELSRQGHQVLVYSIDTHKDCNEEEKGIAIFRRSIPRFDLEYVFRPKKNVLQHLYYKCFEAYNRQAEKKYLAVLDQVKPDVVHFNCLSGMSLRIIGYTKKRGIRTVLTLRDYWLAFPWGKRNNPLVPVMNAVLKPFIQRSLQSVEVVTAPSAFTLDYFIKEGYFHSERQHCEVIENAIPFSLERLQKLVTERKQREPFQKNIRFLFVGSIMEIKGIFLLVEAFKQLADYPHIRLDIVGKGSDAERLKSVIQEDARIRYLGFKKGEELAEAHLNADVLVVPSDWDEPFGRVVIEGNAYALPVIASRRGGIPEIMQRIQGGKLVDVRNLAQFRSVLEEFVNCDTFQDYYRNIENQLPYYSIEHQVDRFLKIYAEEEMR